MCRWMPLALVACGAPVYLPKEPPPLARFDESGEDTAATPDLPCSGAGTTPVVLTVDNRRATSVNLFWLDGGCVEIAYGTVAPSTTADQPTFDTHVWVVRDLATGEYAGSVVLDTTSAQTLVIE